MNLKLNKRSEASQVIAFRHHGVAALVDNIVVGLRDKKCDVMVVQGAEDLDRQTIDYASVGALVVSTGIRCSRSFLELFPNLAGVIFVAIGTESIDLHDAAELNLVVAHGATSENWDSMAEATVLLMLALLYDLRHVETLLADNAPRPTDPSGRMLKGKTVGLVGFGRIAHSIASRLDGWGVDILVCSPSAADSNLPRSCRACGLDELLRHSDVVSLHAAVTDQTRGMIGQRELALMKPSSFLVNTARGALVDEPALVEALRNGRIKGAALDTFAREPLDVASPLRQFSNVILTPHLIGHTQEAIGSLVEACVENTLRVIEGRTPLIVKNPQQLQAWLAARR